MIFVNADGSAVVSGDGDDTVTVTSLDRALDGGDGRDALNLDMPPMRRWWT